MAKSRTSYNNSHDARDKSENDTRNSYKNNTRNSYKNTRDAVRNSEDSEDA